MLSRVLYRTLLSLCAVSLLYLTAVAQTPAPTVEAIKIDSETISGLGVRPIGPAVMGGRVAAVDAVTENGRLTIYVGAASGGVWKSMNGGTTFKPVFDKYTMSIGAITIDPSNPKTICSSQGL